MKTGILLINLGSPDAPTAEKVRPYLRQFLSDPRVLDINPIVRTLILNLFILPFRPAKSAHAYSQIWTKEGSPLINYGKLLTKKVQSILDHSEPNRYSVKLAMRYGNPSIEKAIMEFDKEGISDITVLPLFPQYASASTGSTHEKLMDEIKNWEVIPTIKMVSQFFEHPLFIKAFATLGKKYMSQAKYDHILFSYHGLPERQILKASCDGYCRLGDCCNTYHSKNQYCYRAQCFATTRLLAKELNLKEDQYTICFQSRLGKDPWVKPYTDEVINNLVNRKIKNVLVFSPAFVADCLETTVEIGIEYSHQFKNLGGERWQLVESLNSSPEWIECLKQMVLEGTAK